MDQQNAALISFGVGIAFVGLCVWGLHLHSKRSQKQAREKIPAWIDRRNAHVSKQVAAHKSALAAFNRYYADGTYIAIAITLNGWAQTLGPSKLMLDGIDHDEIGHVWRPRASIDPLYPNISLDVQKKGILPLHQDGVKRLANRLLATGQQVKENEVMHGDVSVTLTHSLSGQEVEDFFRDYERSLLASRTA